MDQYRSYPTTLPARNRRQAAARQRRERRIKPDTDLSNHFEEASIAVYLSSFLVILVTSGSMTRDQMTVFMTVATLPTCN